VTTFGYDPLDRLSSVTDPLLRVQSYTYDDANRVVGQVFTDGSQVGFSLRCQRERDQRDPAEPTRARFSATRPADLMSSYTPPAVAGRARRPTSTIDKQPTVVHGRMGSTIKLHVRLGGELSNGDVSGRTATERWQLTVHEKLQPDNGGKLAGLTRATADGELWVRWAGC